MRGLFSGRAPTQVHTAAGWGVYGATGACPYINQPETVAPVDATCRTGYPQLFRSWTSLI